METEWCSGCHFVRFLREGTVFITNKMREIHIYPTDSTNGRAWIAHRYQWSCQTTTGNPVFQSIPIRDQLALHQLPTKNKFQEQTDGVELDLKVGPLHVDK